MTMDPQRCMTNIEKGVKKINWLIGKKQCITAETENRGNVAHMERGKEC